MKLIIQSAVSIALLWWLYVTVDLTQVDDHLAEMEKHLLWLTIPIMAFDRWLMSAKWNMLLRAVGLRVSQWDSFRIYMISSFVGLFLPATVGSDLSRAAITSREGLPLSVVASSILVERMLGFAALAFMSIVGLLLLTQMFTDIRVGVAGATGIAVSAFAAFGLAMMISFNCHVRAAVLKVFDAFSSHPGFKGRASTGLAKLYRAYLEYSGKRWTLFVFFVLSCLEATLLVILVFVLTLALNLDVAFVYLVATVAIVTFFVRMPISIDGFGIYESGVQFFLSQVGIISSLGLTVGILFHLFCLASILPGGVLLAIYRRKDLRTA